MGPPSPSLCEAVMLRSDTNHRTNSSLDELAAFLNCAIPGSPGHDRYRRRRILRRAFNQPVRIDHINQHVTFGVAAADDLHLLEEQRTPLPKHIVALLHLALEMDRPDL